MPVGALFLIGGIVLWVRCKRDAESDAKVFGFFLAIVGAALLALALAMNGGPGS